MACLLYLIASNRLISNQTYSYLWPCINYWVLFRTSFQSHRIFWIITNGGKVNILIMVNILQYNRVICSNDIVICQVMSNVLIIDLVFRWKNVTCSIQRWLNVASPDVMIDCMTTWIVCQTFLAQLFFSNISSTS